MTGRPAVFLDRDGTVMIEGKYLADPARVELIPGAARALARLRDAGYLLVLVTNQSGIARGLFTEPDFLAVQARLDELLVAEGVSFDAVYHCPHHPEFTGPCDCRKPATGLFRRAQAEHGIDLARSAFIGDRTTDVEPAHALGGRGWLVRTGYGEDEAARVGPEVNVVADLKEAADRLLHDSPQARRG